MQELLKNRQRLLHGLFPTDLFGKLHNFKGIFLLAPFEDALINRIVNAHPDHTDYANGNAQYKGTGVSSAP